MSSSTGRVLLVSVVLVGVASGCSMVPGGTGNTPSVNATSEQSQQAEDSPEQAESVDPADDDPLNVGVNGAKLCSKQPPTGSSTFTILVHNATDQVFTLGDVELGSPQQLTLQSVQVSPANREGHHSSSDQTMDMDMDMEESEAPAPAEPVPATGFKIETHDYINVLVEVSIEENADSGTAAYVELDYSSADRDYTVQHPVEIELTKNGCA